MKTLKFLILSCVAATLCGCGANYAWRPTTPEGMRSVAVPTFRNASDVQELGAIATRQILREFQREGTFKICAADDAALEVQGEVVSASAGVVAYNRLFGLRITGLCVTGTFRVSVIDKKAGRVLIENRDYMAQTAMAAGQDKTTAMRDASGRLAEDLARQVVDDVLNLKWEK